MSDIKSRVQGLDANIQARDIHGLANSEGNIYKVLNVISKRAEDLSQELKTELHGKLKEFAVPSDAIEEVLENKEQIEISKFYERLPNPVVIATSEYMDDSLEYDVTPTTE